MSLILNKKITFIAETYIYVPIKSLLNIVILFSFAFSEDDDHKSCSIVRDDSRVVIAGGSITEIFYLLGIEDRIVALDITQPIQRRLKSFHLVTFECYLQRLLSMNPSIILGKMISDLRL